AHGHAVEHNPDDYIGDGRGQRVDPTRYGASGGSDNPRAHTVTGGLVFVYTKQPLPSRKTYASYGFRLYFNAVQLPLLADQVR
ncbi:hypothetical protein FC03_15005, partial [Staphylococcus aureus]